MRSDHSPVSVAFSDPVLRVAGLSDDTFGEAKRFFELEDASFTTSSAIAISEQPFLPRPQRAKSARCWRHRTSASLPCCGKWCSANGRMMVGGIVACGIARARRACVAFCSKSRRRGYIGAAPAVVALRWQITNAVILSNTQHGLNIQLLKPVAEWQRFDAPGRRQTHLSPAKGLLDFAAVQCHTKSVSRCAKAGLLG